MFKTRLRALLRPLMAAVPLLLTSPLHANDASWQQTLLAARGQTVYFNAWGGDPAVNRYAARIVMADDGMKLLGFLHNPGGGAFVGEISDPAPVTAQPDGLLKLG